MSGGNSTRQSTGVAGLDELLGGGLIPGMLTVVVGATGIGKTQLGLQYANAGGQQEGQRGVIFDCSSRGDSQSHAEYARRMFDWGLVAGDAGKAVDVDEVFAGDGTSTHFVGAPVPTTYLHRGRGASRRAGSASAPAH